MAYRISDCEDWRFGDGVRYHLTPPKDIAMRVPDQVKTSVMFVGIPELEPNPYRATAYVVSVPRGQEIIVRDSNDKITTRHPFFFLATAKHVAEKLEHREFKLRVNKLDGTTVPILCHTETQWWYHPTEKKYVDAAVAMFSPAELATIDIQPIPIGMFATEQIIKQCDIGIGDEVFIAGLFTKVVETTKNIPIIRGGTLSMLPGEKIPFGNDLIYAYLVESRSIGGLSGSPVFVRETVQLPHQVFPKRGRVVPLFGMGPFHFIGSAIGHWDLPSGVSLIQAEAVNMGVSPIVPAEKIFEIIEQDGICEMIKRVDAELTARNQDGAVLDMASDKGKDKPLTKDEFEAVLKKVSRKQSDRK